MTAIDCDEAGLLMCPEIDGELEVANSVSLSKHLNGCSACSETFEQLTDLSRKARTYADQLVVPVDLEKNINAALKRSQSSSGGGQLLKLFSIAAVSIAAIGIIVISVQKMPTTSKTTTIATVPTTVGTATTPASTATTASPQSVDNLVAETGHAAQYKGPSSFKVIERKKPATSDAKTTKPFNFRSMSQFRVASIDTFVGPDGRQIVRTCYQLIGKNHVCVDRYEMPIGLLAIEGAAVEQINGKTAHCEKIGDQTVICMQEDGRDVVYASGASKKDLLAWLDRKA